MLFEARVAQKFRGLGEFSLMLCEWDRLFCLWRPNKISMITHQLRSEFNETSIVVKYCDISLK